MKTQKIYAVAFIINDGKLLIAKRDSNNKSFPGFYELPGGKIEYGESPEDALKRELLEELSLDVEVLEPFHSFSFVFKDREVHGVEIAYFAKIIGDVSQIVLHEHEDLAWITKEELDNYDITEEEKKAMILGFERLG